MAIGEPFSNGQAYDAVVVGAGPAGSAAARRLAAAGARVVVLERLAIPRYKTCGGGVVARALAGMPVEIADVAERRCRIVELGFHDDPARFVVQREQPLICMTMRSELDRMLLNRAIACGAEVRARCAFRGLERRSEGLRLQTDRGTIWTRFLIGADGAAGVVARRAGWEQAPHSVPALEAEIRVDRETLARFAAAARFDLAIPTDGYAWVFPKCDHLSVGVLHMRRGGRGLRGWLSRYLESIGIRNPKSVELHGSMIPVRPRPGGFARDRVLLVGDAAGLADPVTGEGISHAIDSGNLAAEALLSGGFVQGEVERRYRLGLGGTILGELSSARLLAGLLYRAPALRRYAFRRAGPSLCRTITDVIVGRGSYRRLLNNPWSYVRLLRRVAVP